MRKPAAILGALCMGATSLSAATPPAADPAGLDGTYVVVDHRIASGVAATTASYDPPARQRELGQTVDYGDTLVWYDGRFCDDWQAVSGPAPDPVAADPNLADLQIDSDGMPDYTPIALTCADAPFAEVVRIDARVQVAFVPNGTMYVVLERQPSRAETTAIQQALQDRGHYGGPVDGELTGQLRDAVAAFVESQGSLRPQTGIVSEAVLQALQVE